MSASSSLPSGCVIAVVGPSGVGKDTLMDAARAALAGEPRFGFVTRVITRPREAGGEAHQPMTEAEFVEARARGLFALHWHAHGLDYGIPAGVLDEVAAGRVMIVNLSRREIPVAECVFPRLAVIEITAPPAVLAQRLAARGRESAAEIEARLAREAPLVMKRAFHLRLANDRPLAEVAEAFIALIRAQAD
ncbi:MAG: phosphonate metabolism protein/1,5-bisphosphokinase (PRPP-forming) PhnN [Beijerinckiaceae bacterium]|nr:phosphonate metabolism protein/1,5-bisphosphokinase (PRPP-forming) PhnN [Beijerinckiaceae bacterium]